MLHRAAISFSGRAMSWYWTRVDVKPCCSGRPPAPLTKECYRSSPKCPASASQHFVPPRCLELDTPPTEIRKAQTGPGNCPDPNCARGKPLTSVWTLPIAHLHSVEPM